MDLFALAFLFNFLLQKCGYNCWLRMLKFETKDSVEIKHLCSYQGKAPSFSTPYKVFKNILIFKIWRKF